MGVTAHPPPGAADRPTNRPPGGPEGGNRTGPGGWTFLTNHARVLAVVARDAGARIRDIAEACLLTERAVQKILGDLEDAGYITRSRTGRRNTYQVQPGTKVRHPADGGRDVADLLRLLGAPQPRTQHRTPR